MTASIFALALTSALLHAFWNFMTKKAAGRLEVVFLGLVTATIVFSPSIFWLNRALTLRDAYYIGMTGVLQLFYFLCTAGAYRLGEISALYPIARGFGILLSGFIGTLLFHERLSTLGFAGILTTCAGTLTLGFYEMSKHEGKALGLALLTGVWAATSYIYGKLGVAVMPVPFYIFCLALSTSFLLSFHCLAPRHRAETIAAFHHMKRYWLVVGLGSMTSYTIALYALRLGNMSYVVPVRECSVVFGAAAGIILLREPLTPKKAFAVLAIATGAVLIKMA